MQNSFIGTLPLFIDDEADMGLLPNKVVRQVHKAEWFIKPVNSPSNGKSITLCQQNGDTNFWFYSIGFGKNLWAKIQKFEYPEFQFRVYDEEKNLVAEFFINLHLRQISTGSLFLQAEPKTVWRENSG